MNMVWHASHNNALVIHLILLSTNQPRIFYYTLCYDPVTQFQSSCDSCVHLWRSSNAKGFVIGDVAFISSTEIYFALPSKRHKRLYFQTITRMPSERESEKTATATTQITFNHKNVFPTQITLLKFVALPCHFYRKISIFAIQPTIMGTKWNYNEIIFIRFRRDAMCHRTWCASVAVREHLHSHEPIWIINFNTRGFLSHCV